MEVVHLSMDARSDPYQLLHWAQCRILVWVLGSNRKYHFASLFLPTEPLPSPVHLSLASHPFFSPTSSAASGERVSMRQQRQADLHTVGGGERIYARRSPLPTLRVGLEAAASGSPCYGATGGGAEGLSRGSGGGGTCPGLRWRRRWVMGLQ